MLVNSPCALEKDVYYVVGHSINARNVKLIVLLRASIQLD